MVSQLIVNIDRFSCSGELRRPCFLFENYRENQIAGQGEKMALLVDK
jgi:hypothetical protein